jgi:hypothetical protein
VCRLGHDNVGFFPGTLIDGRSVLAGVGDTLVHGLAEIDPVGEHLVDRALGPRLATALTARALAPLRHLARAIEFPGDG